MKAYFALQLRMFHRRIIDLGAEIWLGYLLIFLVFIGVSYLFFERSAYPEYVYAALALFLLRPLSESSRNDFLQLSFGDQQYRRIRFAENALASLPFVIFLMIKQAWLMVLILPIFALLMAFMSVGKASSYTIPTPFGRFPFEFTVGFRNSFPIVLFAYFLAYMAIYVGNFNLGIFALVLIILLCLSYYSNPEAEFFVWIFAGNSHQFLMQKLKIAIFYNSILSLPILLSLSIFFSANAHWCWLVQVLSYLYISAAVFGKYALYPAQINIPQIFILLFCFILPPLLLFFIPFLYLRAKKKLSLIVGI